MKIEIINKIHLMGNFDRMRNDMLDYINEYKNHGNQPVPQKFRMLDFGLKPWIKY